jgi:hypothetical protein
MKSIGAVLLTGIVLVFMPTLAFGDHAGDSAGMHKEISGVVTKIKGGIIFVETPNAVRTISPNKGDRMGLHDVQIGDQVMLVIDTGNVLIDVHKVGDPIHGHQVVTGTLQYVDPFWGEVQVSTPEGIKQFDVDSLAGSKLSVFEEGNPVTLELDEANVMIDIWRGQ